MISKEEKEVKDKILLNHIVSDDLGGVLAKVASRARSEVCLVAPFVKYTALQSIVSKCSSTVNIRLFTRCIPSEYVIGVSDLKAIKFIRERGGEVYEIGNLHAKYYRFDNFCFVGSANVTERALIGVEGNLEFLVPLKFTQREEALEKSLLKLGTEVDEDRLQELYEIVERLKESSLYDGYHQSLDFLESEDVENHLFKNEWIPSSCFTAINEIYLSYERWCEGDGSEEDYSALGLTRNRLLYENFVRYLRNALRKMKFYQSLNDLFDANPDRDLSFGTIRRDAKISLSPDSELRDRQINAMMDWLELVYPEKFKDVRPKDYSRLMRRI